MQKSKMGIVAGLVIVVCLFSFSLAQAGWYKAKVENITVRTNTGDVVVQLSSAADPLEWTGNARGVIIASQPGANAAIANMLTALSLDCYVIVAMDQVPSVSNPQVIDAFTVLP